VAVVNVIPRHGAQPEPVENAKQARQKRLLADASARLARHGIKAETIAAAGDPVAEILAAAGDIRAATIVIGRRQRRKPTLRGSLCAGLVRVADRDVLIVSHDGREHRAQRNGRRALARKT